LPAPIIALYREGLRALEAARTSPRGDDFSE
jgi:hypothetical protein